MTEEIKRLVDATMARVDPPTNQTIELDCPPGHIRPGDLIAGVIEGTGLELRQDVGRFFGNWTWNYNDVPPEKWAEIQPILKKRITKLYEQGIIRYGSW